MLENRLDYFGSYATCEWPEILIENKVLFCSVTHTEAVCM